MHRNVNCIGDRRDDVVEHSRRAWLDAGDPAQARWNYELRWRYADGTEAILSGDSFYGEVVPALPGFEVMSIYCDLAEDGPRIKRQSVLAWRIGSRDHEPIVQDDSQCDFGGIVQPDGRIYSNRAWYPHEAAFMDAIMPKWLQLKAELLMKERHRDCPYCHASKQADDDLPF